MKIELVDLITINDIAKALKQKTVIVISGIIYGLDNINSCLIHSNINSSLIGKYTGLKFNCRDLSAFIKCVTTETSFEANIGYGNHYCISTAYADSLDIEYDRFAIDMVNTQLYKVNALNFSIETNVTEQLNALFNMKKADGSFRFYYNNYLMIIFPGIIPLLKADNIGLQIYDYGTYFISKFIVHKKKGIDITIYLSFLKIR